MTDNLERLHRALVEAMRRTRGDDFDTPITVSQIYQELVPYRVARSAIGFEMNADYEFALLRLLGGERELARLEPAEIRNMLSKEAESPNPNVSLFRAYANCDVWIAPPQDWITEMVADPEFEAPEVEVELELDETPEPLAPTSPATPLAASPRFSAEPVEAAASGEEEEAEDEAMEVPDVTSAANAATVPPPAQQCAYCGGKLPATRVVNFCPHCGNDLTQTPCSSCGEILEAGWKFCVSCGTPASTGV
jgi:predicted RNA-binding Zn-ribbon protein involved in translation (DUF1610 family)